MQRPIRYLTAAALVLIAAIGVWLWPQASDAGDALQSPAASTTVSHTQPPFPGYDFANPTSSFALPPELLEISALTDIDDHTVACVQDELGSIFFVDLHQGTVTRRVKFGPKGDYEGLTRVANTLWVLRSDGLLLELTPHQDELTIGRRIELGLEHSDIEGLAYDPVDNVLLVAPKSSLTGNKHEKARRCVFRFDAITGKRLDGLALDTTIDRIVADAELAGLALATRSTKRGTEKVDLKVRFASLAVHPVDHRIYTLSAVDRALLAFTREGTLFATHLFDDQMPKPEGITFLANGAMVVASEGVGGPARVQVFRYLAKKQ